MQEEPPVEKGSHDVEHTAVKSVNEEDIRRWEI
jgi:hypothetical protein